MALLTLVPELRASLARLEVLSTAVTHSPLAGLRLASALRGQASLLEAIAADLDCQAHDALGLLCAEAVHQASGAASPECAAEQVADALLQLARS